MVQVGKDLKDHLVPSPDHWLGHLSLDQVAQRPIYPDLEHLQGRTTTVSLGNLFQYLTTLILKNFFLMPNINLPSYVKAITPCIKVLYT